MHNMLCIQYLQLYTRVPVASEQVPVASKRVGVASEYVPMASRRVIIGSNARPKPGFLAVLPLSSPCSPWRAVVVSPCVRNSTHSLFSIARDLALGIWSLNRHTVGNSLKRNQLGDS